MPTPIPLVTVGMPVYNGERFLRQALCALAVQTFRDFIVVMSDNCSTDATPHICLEFAESDDRFSYVCQQANLGAAGNINFLIRHCRSPYFMLHAHDDFLLPEYLEACVSALESQPECVLAHSEAVTINEDEAEVRRPWHPVDLPSKDPVGRFALLVDPTPYRENFIHGVMRRDALLKTQLHGHFAGGDRTLIAELSLHGSFTKVPGALFRRRCSTMELSPLELEEYATGDRSAFGAREWHVLIQNLRAVFRSSPSALDSYRLLRILSRRFFRMRRTYAWEIKQALINWRTFLTRGRGD